MERINDDLTGGSVMKKSYTLFLLLVLALGSQWAKVIPMPDLLKPENIVIDKGLILITEFPHVYIYSLDDYKLIKKFGKQGEGPQEFANYVRIQKDPDNPDLIAVGSHMKMSYYTTEGEFKKEIRAKGSAGNVYKPFGKKYVSYGFFQDQESKTVYETINLFDENLNKIKEIYREELALQQNREINALGTWDAWFRLSDDKIFVTGEQDGVILVYDDKGNKLYDISHKYEKIKVTQKDKDRYHNYFKTDPQFKQFYDNIKQLITFPNYFPQIRGMDIVDNRIYVNGYLREDGTTEFTVFDLGGTVLKEKIRLNLPEATARDLYPYTIYDEKIYQLVDNDETEQWELHIFSLK
jgi:hypothetical protein